MGGGHQRWSVDVHLAGLPGLEGPTVTNGTCSIDGCIKPLFARRVCSMHYSRLRKSGELQPYVGPQWTWPNHDPTARFWSRVDVRGDDECWDWKGSKWDNGYGNFRYRVDGQPVQTTAHRYSFELHNGPIEDRQVLVCHTCDNRSCVNPAHLWLGSHQDNADDMVAKGRSARGERKGSKLNPHMVRGIRVAEGTHASIARRYGVSRRLVGMVKERTVWAWVTD